ncbi:MAG: biotin--[acetyl-CoA-carboxylase] ligase [Prolixibacteraceae bacterium]|jgi:BirA family biotin operon repressor/biotin-[acetyl-CoA-carboxylase] ligase|nr:biotin--[acetyl-CoA-carboxylase] ligase [Prolixibacteraceae bacterium]
MDFKTENNIVVLPKTDSTNNYANRQLLESEVGEGTVFLAYCQENGRGQINNRWESEAGKNLTFSLVLKPDFLEITDQFMISKVVALGIHAGLKGYAGHLKIKWPNDIYADDRKLGGILIENSIMSGRITNSVVGIGLNINQEKFVSDAPNPISLKQLTGKDYDLMPLLNQLTENIFSFYGLLKNGNFGVINQLFEEKMYRFGEKYRYKCDGAEFTGTITGVNEIGQLLITDEHGNKRQFHFKEVEFII